MVYTTAELETELETGAVRTMVEVDDVVMIDP